MAEPMPSWFAVLSDVARDPGAPEDVREASGNAVLAVVSLRDEVRTQAAELDRLRAIETRARNLVAGSTPSEHYVPDAEARPIHLAARHILGET